MLNNPIEAWHDAFCSIRSRSGDGSSGITWDVMQGELAKVKHAILALPKKQLDIGMVMFAPDDVQGKYLERTAQFIYRQMLELNPNWGKSLKQIRRVSLLVDVVMIKCRRELNDPQAMVSNTEIAATIGVSASAYSRDYQAYVEQTVEQLKPVATDALMVVENVCSNIRQQYQIAC
ncbi:hypothetical protein [Celerinatantimonas diazotrophica]|uniref:Uncharacterized protein n=1 Tax=Celerinatantimonas diazotrophica TaxID=412034 RepID=A0A4R1K4A2_9GAMM|nr:hypothetical protein [Celerinatantimonas diazotrophica]TCK58956.1 hypothetical protein EV690_1115 [Celerinatantimonas diazotrophica]CAG9297590.1 hypothetical protein CEDIAZO_02778 [Celerinatantimonas diazotrophica]